jgi:hypothetical protein
MLPPTETQKLWVGTCAQDKCYRPHDGTGWKRSGDKPVIYCESCTEHLSQQFTKWGQKGLWCKDNNQRSAFGRLTQKGGPRRTSEAHTANSAYVALTDDSIPKPKVQGTWYEDADADGGYRFEKDQFQQVVQAEATQQDPFGRAYLANPDHAVLTDDTEILNRAPEVEVSQYPPRRFELSPPPDPIPGKEVMVDNPNMFGSVERSDSDDDSPQVFRTPRDRVPTPDWDGGTDFVYPTALTARPNQDEPRDQHGYTQQEWNDWNYQIGKPPPTLEQNLTWISGTDGGYPQDIYTVAQQSDANPSIPLLRIGKGPAPRYSAPVPPPRGVHFDDTPTLHPIPEVVPKRSNLRVTFQDPNNYEEVPLERPGGFPQ